jgi:hypothetical protein
LGLDLPRNLQSLRPATACPVVWERDSRPPGGSRLTLVFSKAGASHDQADAQRSIKSTFQAIHIQFSVMDIVAKSFEMSKTGLGIS